MKGVLPTVAAVIVSMTVMLLGSGLLGTLLGVRAVLAGFPTYLAGIIMAAYFAGLVAGTVWSRPIIQRVGHIRAFSAAAALIAATALLHGFEVSPLLWVVLRVATGCSFAAIYLVVESWLNARATNTSRGAILSVYMIASYMAIGLGQFLLMVDSTTSLKLFALASILFSIGMIPVALTRASAPDIEPIDSIGPRKLYAISPLGLAGCLVAGFVSGAIYGMGPIYAQQVLTDASDVSIFMGATILAGLFFQWPLGRLSDTFDRRTVILWVTTAAGVLALATAIVTGLTETLVFVFAAAFAGVGMTLYPLCVAHANDHIPPTQMVALSASLLMLWGFGSMLGPLIGAGAMQALGPGGLFYFLAVSAALLALFTLYRMRAREAPTDQTPFVAVPRTTPEASQMDPRAETDEYEAIVTPDTEMGDDSDTLHAAERTVADPPHEADDPDRTIIRPEAAPRS